MPRRSLPKPRIFVSHSAHEPDASNILDELIKCLKPDFEVLVDRKRLVAGQDFREEIFSWINRAHGAVVLFSSSALVSQWVRTEASVLAWRHTLGKGKLFPLIPVLLSPIKRTDLDTKEFSPLRLTALQLVRSDDAKTICNKVREGLKPLLQSPPPDTPLEKLARKIAYLLRDVEPPELLNAARAMDTDFTGWNNEKDYPMLLAQEMLERRLQFSMKGIRELAGFHGDDKTETLIELVAPVWVSIPAASIIPQIATRTDKALRRIWVNAGEYPAFTPGQFIRRACCREPQNCWPVLLVPPDGGEDEVGHYKRVIKELLRSKVLRLETAKDKELNEVLIRRDRDAEPVFVAFYPPGPTQDVLAALRAEFETLTFFILTGHQPSDAVSSVQFLEPRLQANEESDAYFEYITAKTYHQNSGI